MLPKKPKSSEHAEQVHIFDWIRQNQHRYPQLRWIHAIPNGAKLTYSFNRRGKRYSKEALKLLDEGMTPGVSDIFVPVPAYGFCGMYIELKYDNNKPTESQKDFMDEMNRRGYLAIACWGSENAIASIGTYLDIPRNDWWLL